MSDTPPAPQESESPPPAEPTQAASLSFPAFVFVLTLKGLGLFVIMCLGAAYGIGAYKAFDTLFSKQGGGASGLMLTSFLVGVPVCIGIIVGVVASRRRYGAGTTGLLATLAVALFVFAAGALLREGMICIVMALPFFLILGLLGALVAWIVSLFLPTEKTPRMYAAVLLPFGLGAMEQHAVPPDSIQHIHRSVYIQAAPETIWRHINYPTDIQPRELESGFAYRIGVPYPIEARTLEPRVGGKRQLVWQRGVTFDEEITAWDANRHIAWRYRFSPDSFPPGSLDDHIVIGGRYFDLQDTSYTLTPEAGGTRLDIHVTTRVSTNFNWYAVAWARFLVGDTADAILGFYKRRSESGPGA